MVLRNFEEVEGLRECRECESMFGRLASPEEFQGAGLFLLSRVSSFMVNWFLFSSFLAFWGVADGDRLEGTQLLMVVILCGRLGFWG